jgi:putative two-component system response regulator
LKQEAIPLPGRIVTIVDVFDALVHERPYKAAWPVEKAIMEIQSQSGRQFDPHVVDAFVRATQRIDWPALNVAAGQSPQRVLPVPEPAASAASL